MTMWKSTVEAELTAPGMTVQILTWEWARPMEFERRLPEYMLSLQLSPKIPQSQTSLSTEVIPGATVEPGELVLGPAGVYLNARSPGGVTRMISCIYDDKTFEELTGIDGACW